MLASSVIATAVLAACAPVPAQADAKFRTDVAAAREKAVKYLKAQQNPQGNWEGVVTSLVIDMDGGMTALATLALLEAGVPANDPAVKKGLEYLQTLPPKKTYVVSLQTQALAKADPKQYVDQIQKNADWLTETAIGFKKDGKLEGWSYPGNTVADNSNTHFAVFGLHAAARAGAKIDPKLWAEVRDYYVRTRRDGGWAYHNAVQAGPSYSMTVAAVVGLAVADKHDKLNAAGQDAFEKGMAAFLAMSPASLKSTGYLFLVHAELGRALGSPTFKAGGKERAWYREGAEKLVKEQQADGSWAFGRGIDGVAILNTAFGLYFLGPPEKK